MYHQFAQYGIVVECFHSRPIALFAPLSRRILGRKIEVLFDSRAKAPPAKRSEKGYGDEKWVFVAHNLIPRAFFTFQKAANNGRGERPGDEIGVFFTQWERFGLEPLVGGKAFDRL